MASESILKPGYQQEQNNVSNNTNQYLEKDNYLSEYSTSEREIVRQNLNVPSNNDVYSKSDLNSLLSQKAEDIINYILQKDDPYQIIPQVKDLIKDMVKSDGTTPFTQPQEGSDPITDKHLTTKKYVDKLILDHLKDNDPHNIVQKVIDILSNYAKKSEVYDISKLYTKSEITNLLKQYIKVDGTTPFTNPQEGVTPEKSNHLATKGYIDNVLYNHEKSQDPHGLVTLINKKLLNYPQYSDIYTKDQTYSKAQISSLIVNLIDKVLDSAIQQYINETTSEIQSIRDENYIKQDGTIPFSSPQSGVDAISSNQLTTLSQVQNMVKQVQLAVDNKECIWETSGPIQSTVGKLEEGSEMPDTMTFQEVCDAIFYGSGITINVPEFITITQKCPITICINGATGLVSQAEVYQDDEIIYTFSKEDFKSACITVDSQPILKNTKFTFKVYYTNGAYHEVSTSTLCSYLLFIGLLPKWKFANTITMEYLKELQDSDNEGTQNRFFSIGQDFSTITFKYKFQDSELRAPFVVIPEVYPNLESMSTQAQEFGIDAFEVINKIPLTIEGVPDDIIYKIYVYKQALSSLDQEVTFNFVKNESIQ